jgi:hypothetical protein
VTLDIFVVFFVGLCDVAMLGGFSLLDINEGWMVVEV